LTGGLEGNWKLVADGTRAGSEVLDTIRVSGTITIEAYSAKVYVN
jgi:hypothetical protein